MTKKAKRLQITLRRSQHGRLQAHKDCVRGLGLRKLHHTVEREDTPAVRGMINKIQDMVCVKEV